MFQISVYEVLEILVLFSWLKMLWKSEAFCMHAGFSDQSYSTCTTQSLPLDLVDTVGWNCPEYNCCSMRDTMLHFLRKTVPEWQCHFTFLLAMPHLNNCIFSPALLLWERSQSSLQSHECVRAHEHSRGGDLLEPLLPKETDMTSL